jgi:hypothetical protein
MSLSAVTKPIVGVSKADCWLTAYSSWCVRVDKQKRNLSFLLLSVSLSFPCLARLLSSPQLTNLYILVCATWPHRPSRQNMSGNQKTRWNFATRMLLFGISSFI